MFSCYNIPNQTALGIPAFCNKKFGDPESAAVLASFSFLSLTTITHFSADLKLYLSDSPVNFPWI
jgi:hypothetical protein